MTENTKEPESHGNTEELQSAMFIIDEALSFLFSAALRVAASLKIADGLREGPRDAIELAREARCDPDYLYRVLRLLSTRGLFHEVSPGIFALTTAGGALRSDAPLSTRSAIGVPGCLGVMKWLGTHIPVSTSQPPDLSVTAKSSLPHAATQASSPLSCTDPGPTRRAVVAVSSLGRSRDSETGQVRIAAAHGVAFYSRSPEPGRVEPAPQRYAFVFTDALWTWAESESPTPLGAGTRGRGLPVAVHERPTVADNALLRRTARRARRPHGGRAPGSRRRSMDGRARAGRLRSEGWPVRCGHGA